MSSLAPGTDPTGSGHRRTSLPRARIGTPRRTSRSARRRAPRSLPTRCMRRAPSHIPRSIGCPSEPCSPNRSSSARRGGGARRELGRGAWLEAAGADIERGAVDIRRTFGRTPTCRAHVTAAVRVQLTTAKPVRVASDVTSGSPAPTAEHEPSRQRANGPQPTIHGPAPVCNSSSTGARAGPPVTLCPK